MLLIHGYGGVIEHWRRVLPLLQAQHTVCAFDLHNFGYSTPLKDTPPGKESWAAQAADVIEQVFGMPAVVVGHSMGGVVAAHLAHQYPHLVRGVVFINSAGLPMGDGSGLLERLFFGAVHTPVVGELMAEMMASSWAVRQGLGSAYYQPEHVTPELVEAFSGPLRRSGGPQAYLAVSRAFDNLSLDITPGDIQAPALVVWGQYDRAMPSFLAEQFRQQFVPQAEVHLIPDTGHCPFDERPEAFAQVVMPWMLEL